jgi:hypothetical protein
MDVHVADYLPPGKEGQAEIRHYEVTQMDALRTRFSRQRETEPGVVLAQLFLDGKMYMSDSDDEKFSNSGFVYRARGDVLIAGLGIGMILPPLLANPEVTSVTVVEQSAAVIALVAQYYADPKLMVLEGDIFEWKPTDKTIRYDAIYFDIWENICTDALPEMAKLHQRFKNLKRSPSAYMDSWQRDYLKYRKAQETRQFGRW